METSIIISGFGGQGALFAGQLLAHAALESGREVTWIPSYGPEMRGGTAHCTVIVGDEPIGSPLVRNPHCVIALNLPSADKYEPLVQAGGILIADGTVVRRAFRARRHPDPGSAGACDCHPTGRPAAGQCDDAGGTAAGMHCADAGGGGGGAAQAAAAQAPPPAAGEHQRAARRGGVGEEHTAPQVVGPSSAQGRRSSQRRAAAGLCPTAPL